MSDLELPAQIHPSQTLERTSLPSHFPKLSHLCRISLLIFAAPSLALASDWTILSVNGAAVVGEPRLSLGEDGSIAGNTGCNSFQGSGQVEDETVFLSGPLAITSLACPGDALATQEQTILRLLQGETTFTHSPFSGAYGMSRGEDVLQLGKIDDDQDAAIEAARLLFDAGYLNVYGLSGPLNVRHEPATTAPVVTRVLAGTLLRNEGCRSGENRDWCNVTFLDASGTTGWAAADYLQPAPATVRAKEGLFDNIGRLSCIFVTNEDAGFCDFGVARDGGHSAVAVVYKPDGSQRVLNFADGQLAYAELASDESEKQIQTTLSDGVVSVTLGDEHYEIPQKIILGDVE